MAYIVFTSADLGNVLQQVRSTYSRGEPGTGGPQELKARGKEAPPVAWRVRPAGARLQPGEARWQKPPIYPSHFVHQKRKLCLVPGGSEAKKSIKTLPP